MKVLIIFREPLNLPIGRGYGLVINKTSWDQSTYKEEYLMYIRVMAMMHQAGFRSTDGVELELNGEEFICGDLTWGCFAEKVEESGVQYAVIEDFDGLDENDYIGELFTNQHKWSELVGRKDLLWQR